MDHTDDSLVRHIDGSLVQYSDHCTDPKSHECGESWSHPCAGPKNHHPYATRKLIMPFIMGTMGPQGEIPKDLGFPWERCPGIPCVENRPEARGPTLAHSIDTASILHRYCVDTVSMLYRYCIDVVSISHRCCIDILTIYPYHFDIVSISYRYRSNESYKLTP